MILTVTPNPALDLTYEVARLVPGASHRVRAVHEVAGGKGLNVASVLVAMGQPVLATGLVGGAEGERIDADLERRGVPRDLARGALPSRRTVTVVAVDDGTATALNEPGTPWTPVECEGLLRHVRGLLAAHRPRVLVASGSVPPGFEGLGYAGLVAAAREAGCATVLDASGPALLAGLAARPDVVKPNLEELRAVTGADDPVEGARALLDAGARRVLVSCGADGLVLVPASGAVLRARLGRELRGNATGAGDAVVAAVAAGLVTGAPWATLLREAVAWSAAAVLQPVAGSVRPTDVESLRDAVTLTEEVA